MIFLEADHSGMNKFPSAEDLNFQLVKSEIVRLVGAGLKALYRGEKVRISVKYTKERQIRDYLSP